MFFRQHNGWPEGLPAWAIGRYLSLLRPLLGQLYCQCRNPLCLLRNRYIYYQIFSFCKGNVIAQEKRGRDYVSTGSTQRSWIPTSILHDCNWQMTDRLWKNSPFIGSKSFSESEAKCNNCQVLIQQLGASLNWRILIEVALPVCWFIVNFWRYNFLSWKCFSFWYGPVHQTLQACSKPTGEKVVLFHPSVQRCYRAPFLTLILGTYFLFN